MQAYSEMWTRATLPCTAKNSPRASQNPVARRTRPAGRMLPVPVPLIHCSPMNMCILVTSLSQKLQFCMWTFVMHSHSSCIQCTRFVFQMRTMVFYVQFLNFNVAVRYFCTLCNFFRCWDAGGPDVRSRWPWRLVILDDRGALGSSVENVELCCSDVDC